MTRNIDRVITECDVIIQMLISILIPGEIACMYK